MVTLHLPGRVMGLKAPPGCLREHCESLGQAINWDLSLSGSWLEGCFEKTQNKGKLLGTKAMPHVRKSQQVWWWQPAWGKCADPCWVSEQEYCTGKRCGTLPLWNFGRSTTAAKLPDLPNPAPLPSASGREIRCCTHSFADGTWDTGMVLGAVSGDLEGVQGEINSWECSQPKKAWVRSEMRQWMRWYKVEFGDPQIGMIWVQIRKP